MAQGKRWAEIDINRLGELLAQALTTLERGENRKLDVDLSGRQVRIVNDPINGRVVIFELSNMMEQRKWDCQEFRQTKVHGLSILSGYSSLLHFQVLIRL